MINDIDEYGELICQRDFKGLKNLQQGLSEDEIAEMAWTLGRFSPQLRGKSRDDPMLAFRHPEGKFVHIKAASNIPILGEFLI